MGEMTESASSEYLTPLPDQFDDWRCPKPECGAGYLSARLYTGDEPPDAVVTCVNGHELHYWSPKDQGGGGWNR